MSEKYSMNELLAWIEKQCSLVDGEWGCASSCEDECKGPKDAIIAQLRAADNLKNKSLMKLAADLGVAFSAAKILEDHVRAEYDAKLRAADKLCATATSNVDNCLCNFGGLDEEGRPFGKQPCNLCDPLRKAIAEYERKE